MASQEKLASPSGDDKVEKTNDGAPPAYSPGDPSLSSSQAPPTTKTNLEVPDQAAPTVEQPFNFPSYDAPLPEYSPAPSSGLHDEAGPSSGGGLSTSTYGGISIVVPQINPEPKSPFLSAYAPCLLRHGITPATWLSFLDTLSAFLAAKVSDRALSHAAEVGARIGKGPKDRVKGLATHTKSVAGSVTQDAKKGKLFDTAFGVIGGAISIPLHAACGAAGAIIDLPGSALAAVANKFSTQRERAEAYLVVANKDWFHKRGLEASLADSRELSEWLGADVVGLIEATPGKAAETEKGLLGGFGGRTETLELSASATDAQSLEVRNESLWLVLKRVEDRG